MRTLLNFWRDRGLGVKIVVYSTLLVLAAVVGLTTLSVQREQANFRADLQGNADLLLDAVALNVRDPLYTLQVDELDEMVKIVGDNAAITQISVYDSRGFLLVDSQRELPIFSQEADPIGLKLLDGNPDITDYEWGPDQLIAGRPVRVGNENIGAVAVGLSTQPLNDKVAALASQSFLIAIGTIIIGLILAFILAQQVTSPLSDLTHAANMMAEGKLATPVKVQSKDEVGQLALVFNQMASRVRQREVDLKDLASGLEGMVKQRTAQLEQQNDDLKVARRLAEEATLVKTQFLATVSHELRTPLNSIIGFSQLLLMGAVGDLNEDQSDRVDRIFKSGQDLLSMINDLLDVSKIEAGRTEIIHQPFAVRDWSRTLVAKLESLAQAKGLKFESEVDPNLPDMLVGDAERLRQVAVNLLGNAIKFTEKGMVSLKIAKQDQDTWAIIVQDTGIGIPSHALETIFEEFRQVDGSAVREYGGSGLGLTIVRKLVVLMGGTVRVQSKVGEGSMFTVVMPMTIETVAKPVEATPDA